VTGEPGGFYLASKQPQTGPRVTKTGLRGVIQARFFLVEGYGKDKKGMRPLKAIPWAPFKRNLQARLKI
jgi:hypothetical protein